MHSSRAGCQLSPQRIALLIPLFAFLCCIPLAARPAGGVEIREIGLQGIQSNSSYPTRVLVNVRNPSPSDEQFVLTLVLFDLISSETLNSRTLSLKLGPGETQTLELPMALTSNERGSGMKLVLSAELRDAAGSLAGQSAVLLKPETKDQRNVVLLCESPQVCKQVQTAITFSGTVVEQADKSQNLRFVHLQNIPLHWWAFSSAGVVILARPASTLSNEQRTALEGHLHNGGRLVVAESMLQRDDFLAAYRTAKPDSGDQLVGEGSLVRLETFREAEVASRFHGSQELMQRAADFWPGAGELDFLRWRAGTNFEFPGLAGLAWWLIAYIIVVGPLNFFVLHRIGHRDWGWLTIPLVSVAFALALYATSAAKRPASLIVDEVTVDWMDDRSPIAAREIHLRVSSPTSELISMRIPSDALLLSQSRYTYDARSGEVGALELGPPQRFSFPIRTWTSQDFRLGDVHTLDGPLRRAGDTLRNDTGRNFKDSIFVDRERVYFLGEVRSGSTVDLKQTRQEPLAAHVGRAFSYPHPWMTQSKKDAEQLKKEEAEWEALRWQPFALIELIRGWPSDAPTKMKSREAIFYGISDEPSVRAEITGMTIARKQSTLTIVSFLPQP